MADSDAKKTPAKPAKPGRPAKTEQAPPPSSGKGPKEERIGRITRVNY